MFGVLAIETASRRPVVNGEGARVRGLWCALILLMAASHSLVVQAADAQGYKVEFASTGIGAMDATLKASSQLEALRTSAPVDPFGLISRARADVGRLKTVLESYGFYQGTVTITVNALGLDDPGLADTLAALPEGTDAECRIAFDLGPQYHLGRIDIDGSVPESARKSLQLSSGAPAIASEVLAGGARVLTTLQNDGYAFAKVDPPIAYENPTEHLLDLRFNVVTGPRVQIGEIHLEGLQHVKEGLVRRRLLVHTGERYSAIAVERARKDLLGLGVFSTADTQLGAAPDDLGRVPVTFRLRERLRHAVSANAAYSTDLGTSAGVKWTDRNLRGNSEQLELAAQVINVGGTATAGIGYNASARYVLPEFAHRDQSLQFGLGALKQSLQAYDQTAATAGVTLSRKLSSIWSANIGISGIHETIVQQGISRTYTLFGLPIGAAYDTTNLASPLADPTHGVRASLNIAPTLSRGNPNSTFIVTQLAIAGYLDLRGLFRTDPGRSVLALRAVAGSAPGAGEVVENIDGQTLSVPDLPPDQRFYAGGSGTVRGYRYQSVGPEFPDGNPMGGTSVTAFNVELRQRIATSFGAVVFVDAGQVSASSSSISSMFHGSRCSNSTQSTAACWAVGIGVGGRYYTPIGALRLDVAVPTFRRSNDDNFEVYIGLGQAF